jgi:hypothetical protein
MKREEYSYEPRSRNYRVGDEKVARLPLAFAFGCCINFCIYAMLLTRATFSWPTLYFPLCPLWVW